MKQLVLKNNFPISGSLNTEYINSVESSDPVQELFNNVPLEITVCESRYETKMYSTVFLVALCIAIPPLLFVAAYMYYSAENELDTSICKFEKQRDEKNTETRVP